MKIKNKEGKISILHIAGIAVIIVLALILINPGGKIRFWEKKRAKDIFEEIEGLIPEKEIKPGEKGLEAKFGEEPMLPIEVPGKVAGLEEPDLFDEDIFELKVEKTAEEKREEIIKTLLIQGKAQIEAGNFTDAATTFTQILRLDPTNEDAANYMYLALSNLRQAEAKAGLTKQIEVLFDRAKLLYEEKDYQEALKEFKKIITLDPNHIVASEYIEKINDILTGESARKIEEERKKEEEARKQKEEELRKQKELMKQKAPYLIIQAQGFLAKKEYDEAIRICEDILEVTPFDEKALDVFFKAVQQKREEEERVAKVKEEIERKQRLLEVEKASIPVKPEHGVTQEKEGVIAPKPEKEEKPTGTLAKISALKERAQQLVSLDFDNADLRDVIRFLVEQTQINIVIDETVLREISSQPAPMQGITPAMMMPVTSPFSQPSASSQTTTPATGTTKTSSALQPSLSQSQPSSSSDTAAIFGAMPELSQETATPEMGATPDIMGGGYALPQAQAVMPGAAGAQQITTSKVTIYLINVPLLKALDAILRSKGLEYKIEEDLIWVSTKDRLEHEDLKVEVFTLKHALGKFRNFSAKGLKVGEETGGSKEKKEEEYSPFLLGPSPTAPKTKKKEEDLWALELGEAESKEAAEREGDIRDIILQFVPQPEGSAIAYYEKVGKLLVRNTPTNIELVRQILESLDISTYQVAIEARILEVSSFAGEDIGISWEKVKWDNSSAEYNLGTGSFGKNEATTPTLTLKYTTLDSDTLEATISALLKSKRGNILSAPKLTCLNNQTSNIRIATNYKYIARWEYDTSGYDQYAREYWTPVIADLDEGIVLNVTPHVNDENMTITLVVEPTINELIEFTSVGDATHPNQLPRTTSRSVQTTVTIKNSQTLVMGGLMKNEEKEDVRKVPILGDIPILGLPFRAKTKYNTKSDLIIFITGTILNSEGRIVTERPEKGKVTSQMIK